MSLEFRVSRSENSEKSSEKVIGGWVGLEGHRGVRRYPVWYISGIGQVQKWGQDSAIIFVCCGPSYTFHSFPLHLVHSNHRSWLNRHLLSFNSHNASFMQRTMFKPQFCHQRPGCVEGPCGLKSDQTQKRLWVKTIS